MVTPNSASTNDESPPWGATLEERSLLAEGVEAAKLAAFDAATQANEQMLMAVTHALFTHAEAVRLLGLTASEAAASVARRQVALMHVYQHIALQVHGEAGP